MAVPDTNLSQEFHQAVTRDQKVAEYVASPQFLQNLRDAAATQVIKHGQDIASCWRVSEVILLPEDAERVKPVFKTLKSEFPDLNHFRIMKHGEILLDTKENTLWRRVTTNTTIAADF